MWNLVPQIGIEPGPHALQAQSLSHWTTRQVPGQLAFKNTSGILMLPVLTFILVCLNHTLEFSKIILFLFHDSGPSPCSWLFPIHTFDGLSLHITA